MIESAEEFVRLRRSLDQQEYSRASQDEAPENVWWQIIEQYADMKQWVVHNKTVPLTILRALSKDPDARLRFAVATKRKCDAEISLSLARDTDPSVRLAVAYNQKTPAFVLRVLSSDSWERVAEVAIQRLKVKDQERRESGVRGENPGRESGVSSSFPPDVPARPPDER